MGGATVHMGPVDQFLTEAAIDHTNIQNIGSNSHAVIDTHLADGTIHFTQAAISITESQISDLGTYLTAVVVANINDEGAADGEVMTSDGVGGVAWEAAGGGDVSKVGTPVDNELGVWTGDGTIEGDSSLTWSAEQLLLQVTTNTIDNVGLKFLDPDGSNLDGWQIMPGATGLFAGALMVTDDPGDAINNRNVTFVHNNQTVFAIGAGVADNASFRSESSGALAYYMPYDTTGREEGKISARGFNPGFADEGLLSIEIYNYQGGTPTLTFQRHTQFVASNTGRLLLNCYGSIHAGHLTGNSRSAVVAGDNAVIGYETADGLQLSGQGSTNDVICYNDAKAAVWHILTGTTDFIADGDVGVGNVTPTAPLHVDQANASGARTVVKLDQGDIDDTFIDFIGTSAADGTRSISSDTTEDSAKFGAFRVEINGVTKWIRVYDDES